MQSSAIITVKISDTQIILNETLEQLKYHGMIFDDISVIKPFKMMPLKIILLKIVNYCFCVKFEHNPN